MLARLFLLCLPFCAVRHIGLLGGFDSNASLLLLFPLLVLQTITGQAHTALLGRNAQAALMRRYGLILSLAAVLTVVNGARLLAPVNIGVDYGLIPQHRSMITAIVPLFLFALMLSLYTLALRMDRRQFQRTVVLSFWTVVGYTTLQIAHYLVGIPFYDLMYPVLEGTRDTGPLSYLQHFGRINGSTQEPAEFGKLLVVYFLPWLVFPLDGVHRPVATMVALALSLATFSIIGIVLAILALVMIGTSCRIAGRLRLSALGLSYLVLMVAVMVGDSLLQGIFTRLAAPEKDASTIIRATYNLAALQLLADNPWLGVGWSNELFLFPEKITHIAYLWEVQNDIRMGNALTAKSLTLRLMMYMGLPLFAYFTYVTAQAFLFTPQGADSAAYTHHDRDRARFVIPLFTLAALIDGGILTSFFGWACLIFPLAMLAPCPAAASTAQMPPTPRSLRGAS